MLFLLLSACLLTAQAPAPRPVAIRCGRLIDGKSATVRANAVILVEGERIRAVGPALAIPAGAEATDLNLSSVLPGLVDDHTHILLGAAITAAESARQF